MVAELVAANSGLGYMILNAMRGLATDTILLGVFTIGLLGLATDVSFKAVRRRLCRGRRRSEAPGERTVLAIEDVTVRFALPGGSPVTALERVSLTVEDRRFSAIVGPSGCGKSTLLRLAAGLQAATEGRVTLDGAAVPGPSAERGMVFQSYTLFPWLTVRGNVEFGPALKGARRAERRRISDRLMEQSG